MLFSILLAHYNNFEYFKDFYQSVSAQSYQNYEIIIVDDNSTDGSLEKIKSLTSANQKVKIFENDINMGVGFTKRRCVEMAVGELCGFVDPDDAIAKNALEISVSQYAASAKIVGTYSMITLCNSLLQPQKIFTRTAKIKNGRKDFFNINNEISHFFTFRKESYLKTLGINEELTASEDFDLYLKMYEIGDLVFIPKPLYLYRLHNDGISQDKSNRSDIHNNWNQMLFDTCQRRNIAKIGNTVVSKDINLAKIIFDKENTFSSKIKRRLFKIIG